MRIACDITEQDTGRAIPATVTAIHPVDGIVGTQSVLPTENYVIEADESYLQQLTVIFSSPGYNSLQTTGNVLLSTPCILLSKSTSNNLFIYGLAIAMLMLLIKKKKRVGKVTTEEVMPFLLIAGALFAVNVIQKILDSLGLGGDPTKGEQADPNSAWKPGYYKKFSNYTYAITLSQADAFAEIIHDAFTLFQDDYNAILGVFSQMKTKSNVSFLSEIFTRKYNEDLLSFLEDGGGILPWDGLSKAHLNTLLSLVSNLPTN